MAEKESIVPRSTIIPSLWRFQFGVPPADQDIDIVTCFNHRLTTLPVLTDIQVRCARITTAPNCTSCLIWEVHHAIDWADSSDNFEAYHFGRVNDSACTPLGTYSHNTLCPPGIAGFTYGGPDPSHNLPEQQVIVQ